MTKILAVHDKKKELIDLVTTFKTRGCDVVAATTLDQARHAINQCRFDVVLACIDVEDGNVFSLLRQVRADTNMSGAHFVLYSTGDRPSRFRPGLLSNSARLLGADEYRAMPHFSAIELWALVQELNR